MRLDEIEARAKNWTLFAKAHERDQLSSWFWDDDVVKSLNEVRKIKAETELLVRAVRQLGAESPAVAEYLEDGDAVKIGGYNGIDPDVLLLLEDVEE